MNNINKVSVALALILATTSHLTFAHTNLLDTKISPYFRIDSGYSKFVDTYVPGSVATPKYNKVQSVAKPHIGGGIGLNIGNNLRADMTYHRHISPVFKSSKANTVKRVPKIDTYFLNVYYDIGNIEGFIPYIGAGVGIARIKDIVKNMVTTKASNHARNNLAYKAIAGATFDITDNSKLDLAYNYHHYGKTASKVHEKQEYGNTIFKGHILSAGIRFDL